MINQSIRYLLAMTILIVSIFALACPNNVPVSNNDLGNTGKVSENGSPAASAVCNEETLEARMEFVRTRIETKLSDLVETSDFAFEVSPYGTQHITVTFKGNIYGQGDTPPEPNIIRLNKTLIPLIKAKCVLRVRFESMGSTAPAETAKDEQKAKASLLGEGFEWNMCEDPLQLCPDGQCLIACQIKTPTNPAEDDAVKPADTDKKVEP